MNTQIGISLSGGGTRGIAHIGVLQALEENNISPDYISGASAGALVGTLYAAGYSPQEILEIFKTSSLAKLFRPSLPSMGLIDNSYIDDMLAEYIGEDDFSVLKKKMFVSVTNLSKGEAEIISEGPLYLPVVTSTCIPILFKTRTIGEDIYADGGVLNNLPVEPLESFCKYVIGVNVSPVAPMYELEGIMDIGYRTLDLAMWNNVRPRLKLCDITIEPNAEKFGYFDLKRADEIFEAGYNAAMEKMPEIRKIAAGSFRRINPYRNRFVSQGVDGVEFPARLPFWERIIQSIRRFFQKLFG